MALKQLSQKEKEKLSGTDVVKRKKGLLITPELCTACRACQVACKEWNKLPADETINRGTYENPPDVNANLYNKIRFVENDKDVGVEWLFISRRCMHCTDAGCVDVCPAPGALYHTPFGTVGFNKDICIGCNFCVAGCPFDIPRYDVGGKVAKCHMCENRVANGLEPACAKVCPTDAIRFGDRDGLIARAKDEGYSKVYGEADLGGLGVVFAFRKEPEHYGYKSSPSLPASAAAWRGILKPLALIGLGGALAAAGAHYVTKGPKDGEGGEE